MAVIIFKSANKTVADIAARDALSQRPDHMVVTVLNAIDDPSASSGTATYRWNASLSDWILISKASYETMSFDTEELLISGGSVTVSNIPMDNQIWDVKVVDGDVIIGEPRDEDLTVSGDTISGLGAWDGYKLRFTYAYGSVSQQIIDYVTAEVANVNAASAELDATQTGAGLNSDGSYSANGSANYISSATSLADADDKLDAQIKTNADAIANMSTSAITQGDTSVEVTDTGSDGSIAMTTDGTERWNVTTDGHLIPGANSTYDIGSAEKKVRHFYLSSNSLKFIDDSNNEYPLSVSEGVLLFNGEAVGSGGDVTQSQLQEVASYLPSTTTTISTDNKSLYFDGSGDYLSIQENGIFNFAKNTSLGTGTIESWVYITSYTAGPANFRHPSIISLGDTYISMNINNGKPGFYWWTGAQNYISSPTAISLNSWHHIAVVIEDNSGVDNLKLYVDGILEATASFNGIVWSDVGGTSNEVRIAYGNNANTSSFLNGYISNLRITDGTALYTSDFSVPTEPLTATAETVLLTANDSTINDDSASNHTITVVGDTSVSSEVPFGNKSLYFDGSGDYISGSFNPVLGTDDFTIEAWINFSTIQSWDSAIIDARVTGGSTNGWVLNVRSSNNTLRFYTAGVPYDGSISMSPNQWYHVAVSKQGTSLKSFINGVQDGSFTLSTNLADGSFLIGQGTYPNSNWDGYISNLRIIKGTALYTSDFSVPTEPLTATAETVLLTANDSTINDDSASNNSLTVVGNTSVSSEVPFTGTTTTTTTYASAISSVGTAGDMYYHDGTSFVKLNKGTTGQTFTVGASGLPEWQ